MKVAILLPALFSLSSLIAQDIPKKIEFGFGGGVNYSFMNLKSESGKQIALPGFQIGLGTKFNLSKKIFLTGQVSYIKQSAKYSNSSFASGTATFEATYSFSWLAAPIQVNYLIGGSKTKNFFFGLGFSPRKLVSEKEDFYNTWNNGAGAVNSSGSNGTNDWNLFSAAQMGMRFSLNQGGSFLILASYERNILDLQKTETLPANPAFSYNYDVSSARLNSFSLGISYYY
jgi:Outer membrane protein beta-barrel domain